MPKTLKLEDLSIAELLTEIRARGTSSTSPPCGDLRQFEDASVIKVLKQKQSVIYGKDNRLDIYELPNGKNLDDADSVVALFASVYVVDNGNGTSTLKTRNFGETRRLCAKERFRNQPTGAYCSGFLVAKDIIATAGHCARPNNLGDIRFVFGFRMRDEMTADTIIDNKEIYSGVAIVGRQENNAGPDWALIRLGRRVSNHRVARIRRDGKIHDSQAVHVIGHPCGLPAKFADEAAVRDNKPMPFFRATLDTYGGNSGSPVFNSDTHEVEGILVRGETDFVENSQEKCYVSLVCPTTGCTGEDCTRTTEFSSLVPLKIAK